MSGQNNLPEGFKMTEIGLLPEDWAVTSLGKLFNQGTVIIQNGFPEGGHNSVGDGIPHLRPFNVTINGGIDLTQVKYVTRPVSNSAYWVQKGDIIFNNTNSEELVGKTAYFSLDGEFVLSNHMTLLRVKPNQPLDTRWLAYLMHHCYWTGVMRSASRRYVNQAAVTLARLKAISFPLPPLPDQKAIARVLSTIQKAVEAQDKIIAAARELKKSLMHHLFTYGPVPVSEAEQVPLRETEIGPVPEHWEVVRLGDIISTGPQNGIYKEQSLYGEGTNILRIDDYGNEGSIVEHTSSKVRLTSEEIEKYLLTTDDILINRVNSLSHLGKVALIGKMIQPMVFESNMMRFQVNHVRVEPAFLFRILASPIAKQQMVGKAKRAVAQSSINQGDVKSTVCPLPPLSVQQEIIHIFTQVDAKVEVEKNRKAALQTLFKTMLHHLMTQNKGNSVGGVIMNVVQTLKEHKQEIQEKYGVNSIAVFGSSVRGELKTGSDVDIVVEFENPNLDDFMRLASYLEELLGRNVDILTPDGIKGIRIREVADEILRSAVYV